MAYYTRIDREACIACGACVMVAPELYDYDDDCLAYFPKDRNQGITPVCDPLVEAMFDAHDGCPTDSVKIAKQPFHGLPLDDE
ncbi:ferredoxin [Virgibacillus proomii]|uniref:ferredoxin n=1 Tax=Virgibacillus proomii TaxID=84407 RepID=UPI001C10916A|nr:ferredoxin [Virgibacillus proomii]MBU5265385.1 ferredoxin [Virgibacillus proomii]